jgi:drug/metabolite transporter (DMT)-like permease
MSTPEAAGSQTLGALYTTLAMLAVAVMAALVKWASLAVSTELLMVLRWVVGLLIFVSLYMFFRTGVVVRTERPGLQALSAFFWTASIFAYYVSLRFLPMLEATLLLNTGSLFAPLIARVLAGERQAPLAWLANGVGFVGVIIALDPGEAVFRPAALLGLLAGFLMAARVYINGLLGPQEPAERTTFYSLAGGLVVCLLAFAVAGFPVRDWVGHMFTPAERMDRWLTDGAMIAGTLTLGVLTMAQILWTAAGLRHASVGAIATFRYSAVVFAAIIDFVVWDHVPQPSAWIGFAIIFLSAMALLRIPKPADVPAGAGD